MIARAQAVAGILLVVALAPGALARDRPSPSAMEPISRGNADGPFASSLGPDGRMHVAYCDTERGALARFYYREESGPGTWSDPETVLERVPERVGLGLAPFGPVMVVEVAGGIYLLGRRSGGGWAARTLADATSGPGAFVLVSQSREVHALVVTREQAGPVLRRARLEAGGASFYPESTLDSRIGSVLHLAAAADGEGDLFLAMVQLADIGRVTQIGLDGKHAQLAISSLVHARFGERLGPRLALPATGAFGHLLAASGDQGQALVWSAERNGRIGIYHQTVERGRYTVADVLLEGEEEVAGLGVAVGLGHTVVVAILRRADERGRLLVRRHDGISWGGWAPPPGAGRDQQFEPRAVSVSLDQERRARIITRERSTNAAIGERIVEWVALPGYVTSLRE